MRFEFPAEGILTLAESRDADLIVMGVHKGAPAASAHLPWAIAYEVVCHAHCPSAGGAGVSTLIARGSGRNQQRTQF